MVGYGAPGGTPYGDIAAKDKQGNGSNMMSRLGINIFGNNGQTANG